MKVLKSQNQRLTFLTLALDVIIVTIVSSDTEKNVTLRLIRKKILPPDENHYEGVDGHASVSKVSMLFTLIFLNILRLSRKHL